MKNPKCIRCGACCIAGCCSEGKENKNGVCKFLIIHTDDTTSCKLVLKNKAENISIGKGCWIQKEKYIWNWHQERRKNYLEYYKLINNEPTNDTR